MDGNMQYLVALLSGFIVCLPLAVQLVRYVKQAIAARRWDQLMSIVIDLMVVAEEKFVSGADRKAYVIDLAKAAAKNVGAEFDDEKVSAMIDALCEMSKSVNAAKAG